MGSERLDLNRHQSVLRIHRTGPGERRISDLGGGPSLVLAEGIAFEKVVLERIAFERVASCHPVQVEHLKDSACHF